MPFDAPPEPQPPDDPAERLALLMRVLRDPKMQRAVLEFVEAAIAEAMVEGREPTP
jgi:hypothetical protein